MTMPNWHRMSVGRQGVQGDAASAHRMDRDAERSDQAMNAYASIYVAIHMQELIDEAARERARRSVQPALRSRIASALSSLRDSVRGPRILPA
jgi:hypothetical protein